MSTESGFAGRLKRGRGESIQESSISRLIKPVTTSSMASTAPSAGRQEASLARGLGKTRGDGAVVDHAAGTALTTLTAPAADMMAITREDAEYGADWRTNLGSKDSGRAGGSNLLFREGKQVDGRIGSSSIPNGAVAAAAVAAAVAATAPPVPPSHANMAKPIARIAVQERKMARTIGLDGSTNRDRLGTSTSVSSSDQQVFRDDNIIIKSRAKTRIVSNSALATTDSGSAQCKTNGKGKTRVSSSGGAAAGNASVSHSVGGHHRRTGGTMEKSVAQVKNAHHSSTGPSSSPRTQHSTMFKHATTASSSSSRSSSRNSNSSSSSSGSHSPVNTFTPISSNSSSSSSNSSSTTNGASRMPVATQRRTSGASSSSNSIDGDGSERAIMDEGMEDSGSGASKVKRRRRSNRSPTNTLPCKTQPPDEVSEGVSGRRSRRRLNSGSESSAASGPASLNGGRLAGGAAEVGAATGVELDSTGLAGSEADARLAGGLGSGGLAPAKKRSRTSAKDSSSAGGSGSGGNGSGSGVSGGRAGSGRGGGGSGRGRGRGKGRGRGRRKGASLLEGLAPRGPSNKARDTLRWRTHRMVEDYVNTCGNIMYPNVTVGSFGYDPTEGQFPLERPSTLGMLRTEIRRPTVIEKWSPYQVGLFEAAISIHGKEFHKVSREVEGKTTGEVVEFYYMWKKTHHYKQWKVMWRAEQAILQAHECDSDESDEDEEGEEEDHEGDKESRGGGPSTIKPGSYGGDLERNQRAETRAKKNGPQGRGGS